jgi:hypothetical protein
MAREHSREYSNKAALAMVRSLFISTACARGVDFPTLLNVQAQRFFSRKIIMKSMKLVLLCLVGMMVGTCSIFAPTKKGSVVQREELAEDSDSAFESADEGDAMDDVAQMDDVSDDIQVLPVDENDAAKGLGLVQKDTGAQNLQASLDQIKAYTQQMQQLVDVLAQQVAGNAREVAAVVDDLSGAVQGAQGDLDDAQQRLDMRDTLLTQAR